MSGISKSDDRIDGINGIKLTRFIIILGNWLFFNHFTLVNS